MLAIAMSGQTSAHEMKASTQVTRLHSKGTAWLADGSAFVYAPRAYWIEGIFTIVCTLVMPKGASGHPHFSLGHSAEARRARRERVSKGQGLQALQLAHPELNAVVIVPRIAICHFSPVMVTHYDQRPKPEHGP